MVVSFQDRVSKLKRFMDQFQVPIDLNKLSDTDDPFMDD